MRLLIALSLLLASCAGPMGTVTRGTAREPVVLAEVVTADTAVSGEVVLAEDLLVPAGVTLTFLPGTRVTVVPSEGTRTDSQFITTRTEILARGTVVLDRTSIGTPSGERGSWGGILAVSPGARVTIRDSAVSGAQYGLLMVSGSATVTDSLFEDNEVGMAAALGAWLALSGNTFRGNGAATETWHTVNPLRSPTDIFEDNDDGALALTAGSVPVAFRGIVPVIPASPPESRRYLGEVAITEDTVWSGTVVIEGQVAVMPEATLTIEPGTHVRFAFRDTNGDGMGESWIIVQGTVRVLGEEDAWVLFDAEEGDADPGAWDSLSIIASDSRENLVRYAAFRKGVKAFHTHFSMARLDHVLFEDNLRGIQFQESEDTVIDWAVLRRNQSAMRFRDSTVSLSNIAALDNLSAINFLRSDVRVRDLVVTGSVAESLVSRESNTEVVRAAVTGNVTGPRFKGDGQRITIRESVIAGNLTEGLSFNHVEGVVLQSTLSGNGFTGLSVTDAPVTVTGSRIAGNGRFAVDNNGTMEVDARGNDWGSGGLPSPDMIYDGQDEDGIGAVLVSDPARFRLFMPGMTPPAEDLGGRILVVGDVTTPPDLSVRLEPGTSVSFSTVPEDSLFDLCSDHPGFPSSELNVLGKIEAVGTREAPIAFGPAGEGSRWGAVNLAGGKGGSFENCLFTGASTGIHAREALEVSVRGCVFDGNEVGLRFSSTRMAVTGNLFRANDAGLRFHEFGGVIEGNTFEGNNSAIFVTGNPEGVALKGNTFRTSRDYHVKLGIHVTQDIEIRDGSFKVPEGKTFEDMVFDEGDDGELGRVVLRP